MSIHDWESLMNAVDITLNVYNVWFYISPVSIFFMTSVRLYTLKKIRSQNKKDKFYLFKVKNVNIMINLNLISITVLLFPPPPV